MKLYFNHTEGGQWVVPGKQAKGSLATRVDVPGTPTALAAWLNERRVPLAPIHDWQLGQGRDGKNIVHDPQLADDAAAPDPAPCNTPTGDPNRCSVCQSRLHATPEGTLMLAASRDLDAFEDWLALVGPDRVRLLQRAAELIGERARAIGAEWDGRSVQ